MEPLLSLCMIVKDEEETLARCLDSVLGLVDEIIIVDTGSTDRTKEIASSYTSKIHDFEWVNDFSAARNESIRHASGKWILVMDADEYINPDDIKEFRLFLQEETVSPSSVFSISVISYVGKASQTNISEAPIPRLFPNFQGIKYARPIHEQLVGNDNQLLFSKPSPLTVFHTGYVQEIIEQKEKLKRNELIFTALKKKSGFTPYDLYTLGNECLARGDQKKALYNYERALAKATEQNPWRPTCAFQIFNIFVKTGRYFDAWGINENIFNKYANYPEYACFQGIIYEEIGMFAEAKSAFSRALEQAELLSQQEKFWLVNPIFGSTYPLARLAHLATVDQNIQDIVYYNSKLLQADPSDRSALMRVLEIITMNESVDSIQVFINKLYPSPKQYEIIMLTSLFTYLGQHELSKTYYAKIENPDDLRIDVMLNYAILHRDKSKFEQLVKKLSTPVSQIATLRSLTIGALLWEGSAAKEYIIQAINSDFGEQTSVYMCLLEGSQVEHWSATQTIAIYELITEIFMLQHYELFDQIVQTSQHPVLLDLLANFFYSKHQFDLALNYYQILLERDELSAASCINLAYYHLNRNMLQDGLAFLQRAIELEPSSKLCYVQMIIRLFDKSQKQQVKDQLFYQFPSLRKLPFLQQL